MHIKTSYRKLEELFNITFGWLKSTIMHPRRDTADCLFYENTNLNKHLYECNEPKKIYNK